MSRTAIRSSEGACELVRAPLLVSPTFEVPMSGPRPELLALLDAIKDDPDEDTPRLVLADWLDEQDNELDARRAAFIRAHIAHARGVPMPGVIRALPLAPQMFGPLFGAVSGMSFERGLPSVRVRGEQFIKPEFVQILPTEDFAFVQFVQLAEVGGQGTEAAVSRAEFRHVAGLGLYPSTPLGTDGTIRVFGSPHLDGLRRIIAHNIRPGADGVDALANNPALGRLRKLFLPYNALADKAVVALAASPHLTNLQTLDLSHNSFGDKGAEALAASAALRGLRSLDVTDNARLTDRGKAALSEAFGDRAKFDP